MAGLLLSANVHFFLLPMLSLSFCTIVIFYNYKVLQIEKYNKLMNIHVPKVKVNLLLYWFAWSIKENHTRGRIPFSNLIALSPSPEALSVAWNWCVSFPPIYIFLTYITYMHTEIKLLLSIIQMVLCTTYSIGHICGAYPYWQIKI